MIGEFFMKYAASPSKGEEGEEEEGASITPSSEGGGECWPSFRGADRSNIVRHGAPLKLATGELKELWSVETGEGHAAPAVWRGRVFVLDYGEELSSDALRCMDLTTGHELWRRWWY